MAGPVVGLLGGSERLRVTLGALLEGGPVRFLPGPGAEAESGVDLWLIASPTDERALHSRRSWGVPWLRVSEDGFTTEKPDAPWQPLSELPAALRRKLAASDPILPPFLPWLQPPRLPAAARPRLAWLVDHPDLPVLLRGEPGSGRLAVVRSIVQARGAGRLHLLPPRSSREEASRLLATAAPGEAVLVPDLEQATDDLLLLLALHLPEAGLPAPPCLLFTTGRRGPDGWQETRLPSPLREALTALAVDLPPLRERMEDFPRILDAMVAEIAPRSAGSAPEFTAAARDRLAAYLWPGNLAELAAVLQRTLLSHAGRTTPIEAGQIAFSSLPTAPPNVSGSNRIAPTPNASPSAGGSGVPAGLASLAQELAHELRNPMVAVQTAAHQIRQGKTGEKLARAMELAGTALSRIDRVIENLIQYSQMGPPAPQPVTAPTLLGPSKEALSPLCEEKGVSWVAADLPADAWRVDPAQLSLALELFLRTLLRDLPEGGELRLGGPAPAATLAIRVPRTAVGVVARLQTFTGEGDGTKDGLGAELARELIERNGGSLQETEDEGGGRLFLLQPGPLAPEAP